MCILRETEFLLFPQNFWEEFQGDKGSLKKYHLMYGK